jgi:hypothetical protein
MGNRNIQEGKKEDRERTPFVLLNQNKSSLSARDLTRDLTLRPKEVSQVRPEINGRNTSSNEEQQRSVRFPQVPSLGNGASLDSELINPLKEVVSEIEEHLKIEEDKKRGATRNLESAEKEKTLGLQVQSAGMWCLNRPYWAMHKVSSCFNWGVCKSPPTTLAAQNQAMIDECKAQVEYQENKVLGMKKKIDEISTQMDALSRLNDSLKRDQDPRRFLEARRDIQTRTENILALVDQARNLDDPSKKEAWNKKRAALSEGLHAIDKQLQFTETTLRVTQKVAIISGAIVATGGAAAPVAAGGYGLGAAGAGLGFWGSAAVGTGTGMVASLSQVAGENIGRGVLGQELMSGKEVREKILSDTKDAALYSTGSGIASRVVGTGSKLVGNLVLKSKNIPGGNIAVEAARANSAGKLSLHLIGKGAGSLVSGINYSAITEAPAALVDTYIARNKGEVKPEDFWWEVWFRLGNAATGGSIGRGFAGGRSAIGNVSNTVTRNGSIVNTIGKRTLQAGTFAPELFFDTQATLLAERVKAGWVYGKDGELSDDEFEQILISSFIGNVNGWRSEISQGKNAALRSQTVENEVRKIHTDTNKTLSDIGVESNQTIYVGTGNAKTLRVNGSKDEKNTLGVHLGSDPVLGRFGAQHQTTNKVMQYADKKTGGRIQSTIVDPVMKLIRGQVQAVTSRPTLSKERERFIKRLEQEVQERSSGVSSLALYAKRSPEEYAEALSRRTQDFNNARKILDADGKKDKATGILRFLDPNPYGVERTLKVLEPKDYNIKRVVTDVAKGGISKLGRFIGGAANILLGESNVSLIKNVPSGVMKIPVVGSSIRGVGSFLGGAAKLCSKPFFWVFDTTIKSYNWVSDSRPVRFTATKVLPLIGDTISIPLKPAYGIAKSWLVMPPPSAGPGGGTMHLMNVGIPVPNSVGLIIGFGALGVKGIFNTGAYSLNRIGGFGDWATNYRLSNSRPEQAAKMLSHLKEGEFYKSEIETLLRDRSDNLGSTSVELRQRLKILNQEIKETKKLLDIAMKRGINPLLRAEIRDYGRIIDTTTTKKLEDMIGHAYRESSRTNLNDVIRGAKENMIQIGSTPSVTPAQFAEKYLPLIMKKYSPLSEVERNSLLADVNHHLKQKERNERDPGKREKIAQKIELLRLGNEGELKDVESYLKSLDPDFDSKLKEPRMNIDHLAKSKVSRDLSRELSETIFKLGRIDNPGDPNIVELNKRYKEVLEKMSENLSEVRYESFVKDQELLIAQSRVERMIRNKGSEDSSFLNLLRSTDNDSSKAKTAQTKLLELSKLLGIRDPEVELWINGSTGKINNERIDALFDQWRTATGKERVGLEAEIKKFADKQSVISERASRILSDTAKMNTREKDARNLFNELRNRIYDTMSPGKKESNDHIRNKTLELLGAVLPKKSQEEITRLYESFLGDKTKDIPVEILGNFSAIKSTSDNFRDVLPVLKEIISEHPIQMYQNIRTDPKRPLDIFEKAIHARGEFDKKLISKLNNPDSFGRDRVFSKLEQCIRSIPKEVVLKPDSNDSPETLKLPLSDRLVGIETTLAGLKNASDTIKNLDLKKPVDQIYADLLSANIGPALIKKILPQRILEIKHETLSTDLNIIGQLLGTRTRKIPGFMSEIASRKLDMAKDKEFGTFIEAVIKANKPEANSKEVEAVLEKIVESGGALFPEFDSCVAILQKHRLNQKLNEAEVLAFEKFTEALDTYVSAQRDRSKTNSTAERVIDEILGVSRTEVSSMKYHADIIVKWEKTIEKMKTEGVSVNDIQHFKSSLSGNSKKDVIDLENRYRNSDNEKAADFFRDTLNNWDAACKSQKDSSESLRIFDDFVHILAPRKPFEAPGVNKKENKIRDELIATLHDVTDVPSKGAQIVLDALSTLSEIAYGGKKVDGVDQNTARRYLGDTAALIRNKSRQIKNKDLPESEIAVLESVLFYVRKSNE